MAKPLRGVINVDVTQSVPDWEPYTQPIAVNVVMGPAFMDQQCRGTAAPRIGPVGDLPSRRNPRG